MDIDALQARCEDDPRLSVYRTDDTLRVCYNHTTLFFESDAARLEIHYGNTIDQRPNKPLVESIGYLFFDAFSNIQHETIELRDFLQPGTTRHENAWFLDDERDPPSDAWRVFRNGEELIDALKNEPIAPPDILSLDHDLGDGANGAWVARWIANQCDAIESFDQLVVHSANPSGAKRMMEILDDFQPDRYRPSFGEAPHQTFYNL